MAATPLNVKAAPGRTGYNNTNFTAVDAVNGNMWANTGKELLAVVNGSGGSLTVTLDFGVGGTLDGSSASNKTFSVPVGDVLLLGPFPPTIYNDVNGNVTVTFSSGTSVVAVVYAGR